jgi:hypothetical protein
MDLVRTKVSAEDRTRMHCIWHQSHVREANKVSAEDRTRMHCIWHQSHVREANKVSAEDRTRTCMSYALEGS